MNDHLSELEAALAVQRVLPDVEIRRVPSKAGLVERVVAFEDVRAGDVHDFGSVARVEVDPHIITAENVAAYDLPAERLGTEGRHGWVVFEDGSKTSEGPTVTIWVPKEDDVIPDNYDLIFSAGHAECMPNLPSDVLHVVWDTSEQADWLEDGDNAYDVDAQRARWEEVTGLSADRLVDADLSFENIVRFTGDYNTLALACADLLAQVAFPPSGDDDTFDYWPSGVRFLLDVAGTLGEAWYELAERVVRGVLRWLELTGNPGIIPELLDKVGLELLEEA